MFTSASGKAEGSVDATPELGGIGTQEPGNLPEAVDRYVSRVNGAGRSMLGRCAPRGVFLLGILLAGSARHQRSKHMIERVSKRATVGLCGVMGVCIACGSSEDVSDVGGEAPIDLASRAYVISEQSNELFVMDVAGLTEVGKVDTSVGAGANANHMSMLNGDGSKIFITASEHDTVVVVDTTTLQVSRQIPVGAHPTHAESCMGCGPNGQDLLWV